MQMRQGRCETRFTMSERLHLVADFRLLHALRVRWAEVDLQKIVFNPHYLAYVDTAMADYWRALALPYEASLQRLGGDLFVKKSTLEFHASAHYDDRLTVGLRCARIGNSSLQFLSGIFRDQELLVSAELVYVFADPIAKTALTVPLPLRNTMLAYEQDQPIVRQQMARWDEVQAVVQRLRAPDDHDADAVHCVLRNALDEPIATARMRVQAAESDGVAVIDSLRGAGWGRAAAAALRQLPRPGVASLSP
jgi:YbgC/YbaW family acyl-CoA thioester hydrolase